MGAPTASLADSFAGLSSGAVAFVDRCDLVTLSGPDARSYLQGQCTQDVAELSVGEARFTLLLSVQGKVEALCRVGPVDAETFVLDTEAGQGGALLERLRRFKIRIKAELTTETALVVRLRGPMIPPAPVAGPGLLVRAPLSGRGYDLIGERAEVPDAIPLGDGGALELARIVAGEPRMTSELDDTTIPFEAGIVQATTSFTKGCYTGQELIARLEARGANVPRRLRALRAGPQVPLEALAPGASVHVGGEAVGRVTSSARLPAGEGLVALAYLQRKVVPPTDALVQAGGELPGVPVEVHELPGLPGPSVLAS